MIVIAIAGLLFPGYLLARVMRCPVPWAVAFPLSALLLTEIVIAYTLLGIPIRFGFALVGVVIACSGFGVVWLLRKPQTGGISADIDLARPGTMFVVVCIGLVGIVLLGILMRTALYPLSGPDVVFRWDALPRLMLEYQSLSYYPPVTFEDFTKYTYPDGFPPLVATVYWWLYAALGKAIPRITSLAIFLQAASCFALVFYAARTAFGTSGGVMSLIALASSAIFLCGVAMGQENGYTAISYAGQLLFALTAARTPKANLVVIAGLFAGLGALTREYGPLLSIAGLAVLASRRETLRLVPLFCAVTIACASPWYVRNWVLSGNPLYSLDVGLGFPVNPVHAGILSAYRRVLDIGQYQLKTWIFVAKSLLGGAPLAILIGLPGIAAARRNGIALGISALAAFFLWFSAIPYTAGGVVATWRVLTPGCVALSIAAGSLGPVLLRATDGRKILLATTFLAFVICGCYASLWCWCEPFAPSDFPSAIATVREEPLLLYVTQLWIANKLEKSNLPTTGLLTEDCNLATILQRNTRFCPVMVWSPAVEFIFEPNREAGDVRRRLIEKNICLVAVTFDSINNAYLGEFPFFKDLFDNSQAVLNVPESQAIVYLPNQTVPKSEAERKP